MYIYFYMHSRDCNYTTDCIVFFQVLWHTFLKTTQFINLDARLIGQKLQVKMDQITCGNHVDLGDISEIFTKLLVGGRG